MRITFRDGIFVAICSPEERHALGKAGFWYHDSPAACKAGPATCPACKAKPPLNKLWWTRRTESAARLSRYADDKATAALARHLKAVEMSRATDADIEIPCPTGRNYFPYQKAGIAFLAKRDPDVYGKLLGDEMGLGKSQALDSKLLTPTGWIKMGDAYVGCDVINSDGQVSQIVAIYPQGIRDVFKITFQDGSSTECCDEHLWSVNTPTRRHRGNPDKILQLSEIRKKIKYENGNKCHYIPVIEPIRNLGNGTQLPLDPYLLGYLIGNGCFTRPTPSVSTPDQETIERLSHLLIPLETKLEQRSEYDWAIMPIQKWDRNKLKRILKELGIYGEYSYQKVVPEIYLWSSFKARQSLLQGLLDSDGHVRPVDNNIEYSTSSKALAEDAVFIVRSLGGICRIREKKTQRRLSYRMSISLPSEVQPFRLARKSKVYHPRTKYLPYRAIESVEYVGSKETQCIAVNSPDKLYITDDFIVTHNTPQFLGLVNLDKTIKNVLVVCPASLRINWHREARRWLVQDDRRWQYHIVDQDEPIPADSNFVIANYNRITIGYRKCQPCNGEKRKEFPCSECKGTGDDPMRERTLCSTCRGKKISYCTECRGRGKIARDNLKIVGSIMEREWDIAGFDECHAIKNPKAARTRAIIGNAAKRQPGIADQARQKIFITGTPLPNRPIEMWPLLSLCSPRAFGNLKNYAKRYCDAHEEWQGSGKKVWTAKGASNLEELQERMRATCLIRRLKADVLKDLPPKIRQIVSLVPTESAKKLIAEELEIWDKKFGSEIETIQESAAIAREEKNNGAYDTAVQRLKYIQSIAFMEMATMRHNVAVAKIPSVVEHLQRMFKEGVKKIICFAHHHDVIEAIQAEFKDCAVSLYGSTKGGTNPNSPRQQAIDKFQNDKVTKLFIGGIMAAGTGITLTASSHVVFAELDWTPSNVTQAEDRAHRIGQRNSVLIQHLVLDGSLDARMAQILVEKQDIADRALDNNTDVAVQGLLQARPEAPVEPVAYWKKIILREAMAVLGQRRDPNIEGSHGFSQFDAIIGQKLATWDGDYSDKQAHLAIVFAKRYRGQLPEEMQKKLDIWEAPKTWRKVQPNKKRIPVEDGTSILDFTMDLAVKKVSP